MKHKFYLAGLAGLLATISSAHAQGLDLFQKEVNCYWKIMNLRHGAFDSAGRVQGYTKLTEEYQYIALPAEHTIAGGKKVPGFWVFQSSSDVKGPNGRVSFIPLQENNSKLYAVIDGKKFDANFTHDVVYVNSDPDAKPMTEAEKQKFQKAHQLNSLEGYNPDMVNSAEAREVLESNLKGLMAGLKVVNKEGFFGDAATKYQISVNYAVADEFVKNQDQTKECENVFAQTGLKSDYNDFFATFWQQSGFKHETKSTNTTTTVHGKKGR